jgi:hypothetical protein
MTKLVILDKVNLLNKIIIMKIYSKDLEDLDNRAFKKYLKISLKEQSLHKEIIMKDFKKPLCS